MMRGNAEYIEITAPDDTALRQFHDILVEAFPDPYEREDMEILRENLLSGSWSADDEMCRYHLLVARQNMQVVGGTSFYFYANGRYALGMGAYLAVKREFRQRGIGTNLIARRNQTLARDSQRFNRYLKGLIIQISDPDLMNEEEIIHDTMNPRNREQFWRNRGYKKIDFDFIQPPIRKGEPPIEYLSLYVFPYCAEWRNMEIISSAEIRNIVDCFIKCTGTPGPAETDPAYVRMKEKAAEQKFFRIY